DLERDEAGGEPQGPEARDVVARYRDQHRSERLLSDQADADAAFQRRALGVVRTNPQRRNRELMSHSMPRAGLSCPREGTRRQGETPPFEARRWRGSHLRVTRVMVRCAPWFEAYPPSFEARLARTSG